MRHLQSGRKLGVNGPHRKAMMRSMTLALIEQETIKTTPPRAKELRWYADRIITLGKKGDLPARRRALSILGTTRTSKAGENRVRKAIDKVFNELAPRYSSRSGGYTQMFRLAARRKGDNAELCLFRYIPGSESSKPEGGSKKKKKKKKASGQTAAKASSSKGASEAKGTKKKTAKKKKAKSA